MQNERIAIRFTSPGKNQFLLKPFILVFEFAIQINDVKRFLKCLRHTMFMDTPMVTLTKDDGIVSLMHCQEWDSVCLKYFHFEDYWTIPPKVEM